MADTAPMAIAVAGGEESARGSVLELARVSKGYGERAAVDQLSLEIRSGEVFGLLGPNGAGKTTTIGMAAGIVRPSKGAVRVVGRRPDKETRRRIGLVPQEPCLYPALTAEENLRFFGRMYGLEASRLRRRIEALLDFIGLTNRAGDQVRTYSGGMKRRLNLACGLIHQPLLLLLDEPTVGVDPQSRERIFVMVERLTEQGLAILYTTHYMEEAERLCERVGIMDEGRLVAEGKVTDLARRVGGERFMRIQFEAPPSSELASRLIEKGARQVGAAGFEMPGESTEELLALLVETSPTELPPLRELIVHRPTLDEIFLHLTGKELRD